MKESANHFLLWFKDQARGICTTLYGTRKRRKEGREFEYISFFFL
jgi:hypothetical protein